jgi:hypothetical protein
MSERGTGEGNTEAPRVEENEVRSEPGREDTGPRRVGDVREEREAERSRREKEFGTSWVSVVLGWLAALGASLILSGIVAAIVGAILGAVGIGQQGATSGGISGLVGVLVTLFLAFLIGGYVAGRMASRSGLKHGVLVPLLALVITLVLALIGAVVGASFIDQLTGVTLPGPIQNAAQSATQGIKQPQNLGTILSISGIVALLVPFVGGAIGGAWGARTGRDRP